MRVEWNKSRVQLEIKASSPRQAEESWFSTQYFFVRPALLVFIIILGWAISMSETRDNKTNKCAAQVRPTHSAAPHCEWSTSSTHRQVCVIWQGIVILRSAHQSRSKRAREHLMRDVDKSKRAKNDAVWLIRTRRGAASNGGMALARLHQYSATEIYFMRHLRVNML